MGYKLMILSLYCMLTNVSCLYSVNEGTAQNKEYLLNNKNIILQIINKCDQIIDKLKKSNNQKYISIFEEIKQDFNKNQKELRLFLSGNKQQKIEKINQYLNRLNKCFSDILEVCNSNLTKGYNKATMDEIRNKYEKVITNK